MRPLKSSAHLVALVGGLCLVAALAVTHLDPGKAVRNLREDVFDLLLILSPRSNAGSPVVVIDIGRDALEAIGPWPWPRDRLAELIDKIADAKPAALAINILLSAREPPESDPADERLAKAIARAPTVLAMVLDPAPNPVSPSVRRRRSPPRARSKSLTCFRCRASSCRRPPWRPMPRGSA